jgi:hypothetical protein
MERLSHSARLRRREAMAAAVAGGESHGAVARRFGVGVSTVKDAVREFGGLTVRPDSALLKFDSYRVVADLVNTADPLGVVAERHRVSVQRVQQVYARCREAGVPVKVRPSGRYPRDRTTSAP